LYDAAKSQFDAFWKFRTDAPEKAADYIKSYAADPTIASVPVPAKAEDTASLAAPTPATGPANVKLSGGAGMAPSAGGKSATNGNGSKATTTKGSKATKSKGKKRRG
jgi:hypothetical protein